MIPTTHADLKASEDYFGLNVRTNYDADGHCSSYGNDVAALVTNNQVNTVKNIYFIQLGLNLEGVTPVGCSIDHSSIDWSAYDLTGGFGSYAEKSYDANSYNGVNFYKADNITPLGVQSTCGDPTTYVASTSTNPNGYNNSYSFLV